MATSISDAVMLWLRKDWPRSNVAHDHVRDGAAKAKARPGDALPASLIVC